MLTRWKLPRWVLTCVLVRILAAARLCREAVKKVLGVASRHRVLLGALLAVAVRSHVGLFYSRGRHVEWAKRVAGVGYAYVGADTSVRPNYSLLGWFVAVAVAGQAVDLIPLVSTVLPHRT